MENDDTEFKIVLAYMNEYGKIIPVEEYEYMRANPKTTWVIEKHWSNIVPLGRI
jgi:hypothetical protein